jgi:hypothetical protein
LELFEGRPPIKYWRRFTPSLISRTNFVIACLAVIPVASTAQQVVHAMVGTVSSIDSAAMTITVLTDDGNELNFKALTNNKIPIVMDKAFRASLIPAQSFQAKGTVAVVLFFGDGFDRTAVALRGIGPGPFTKTIGTIVRFSGRDHFFAIKDDAGNEQTFKLAPDSIAETRVGAVDGKKFEPDTGDQVRVTFALINGTPTAVFIYAM